MRQIILYTIVFTVAVAAAHGQLGSRPAGYTDHVDEEFEIAFYYPDGWYVANGSDSIWVVNREALLGDLNREAPDVQPGDAMLTFGILPTMLLSMMGISVDDQGAIVDGIFENMMAEDADLQNRERMTHQFGGREVPSILFDNVSHEVSGIVFVTHEQENVIVFGVALGFREDLVSRHEQLAQVVSTVEFTGSLESLMGQ